MIGKLIPRELCRTRFLIGALLLLCCSTFCWSVTVAHAYTISMTGESSGGNPGGQALYEVSGLLQGDAFNVSWGGVSGLDVDGMVIIDSLTATDTDIRVMLDNISAPISGDDPRVTSVGVGVTAFSSIGSTSTNGTYLTLEDDSNFPGFTVDVCGTSGSNCAGGGSGGIPAGDSDDLTLRVNGSFTGTLTLANFSLKIQGGPSGNSFELAGVPTPKTPGGDIPEPMTLVLAALGICGFAAKRRSRG